MLSAVESAASQRFALFRSFAYSTANTQLRRKTHLINRRQSRHCAASNLPRS
jgi:hypothetical protein